MITKYYIPRSIWIDSYKDDSSQFKILMRLVSAPRYDVYLKDWDMDYINCVAQFYSKISKIVTHGYDIYEARNQRKYNSSKTLDISLLGYSILHLPLQRWLQWMSANLTFETTAITISKPLLQSLTKCQIALFSRFEKIASLFLSAWRH